ncbi:DUF1983 domain-containing protein [Ectopseudomonas mendocina]|uniref:DUF1983 domain-containing protein n=1 Tax=Ectopseudomonas mendocina TaxID=300 RepID=A0ABZ2RL43_ECTME
MTNKRTTLPPLPPGVPSELRPLFQALKEIIETGEGMRGDKLDRKLTVGDMLDGGLAKLRIPGNPDGGLIPSTPLPDMSMPPAPTGFSADGSFFGMVHLSWDTPQEIYNNHAFTNIYRSEVDNIGQAKIIGREAGMFYSDKVRDDVVSVDNPLDMPGFFYWVSFTSTSNVEGPPNSPNGTFAKPLPDAKYLLGQLSGQLGESELEQALRSRLDGFGSSIQQQAEAVKGLSAQFTLKLDVNGYVSGFGAANDGKTADFAVLADRFWIARPGAKSSAVKPFMVVDGKVYIDSAFIREASIQEGQLGPITFGKLFDATGRPVTTLAGKLRADMLDVDSLRVGDANIAGVLKSSQTGANGRPRWALDKNGGLELNSAGTSGRMEVRENVIKVFDGNGVKRVQLGNLTV